MLSPRFAQHILNEAYKYGNRYHIYLSGPMTGLPDYNRPAFDALAEELRAQGYTVFNPADVGERDVIRSRSWYMRRDIEGLMKSDKVYVLPGYAESAGALLEIQIAKELELPVIYATHPSVKKG
jgi:hypothetical protein